MVRLAVPPRSRLVLGLLAASWAPACSLQAPPDDALLAPNDGAPHAGSGGEAATFGGAGSGGERPGDAGGAGNAGTSAGGSTGGSAGGDGGTPPDRCHNGRTDLGETDTDCGGEICSARCGEGDGCAIDDDCGGNLICAQRSCKVPGCGDRLRNGGETDVLCGGACPLCADGLSCSSPTECQSGVCTAGQCAAPTCDDGALNGSESDTDCGGSCPPCGLNQTCESDTDCDGQQCGADTYFPESCERGDHCLCGQCETELTRCRSHTSCEYIMECFLMKHCSPFEMVNGVSECVDSRFCWSTIGPHGGVAGDGYTRAHALLSCLFAESSCRTACLPNPE